MEAPHPYPFDTYGDIANRLGNPDRNSNSWNPKAHKEVLALVKRLVRLSSETVAANGFEKCALLELF
jgi:hypothetical protein